MFSDLVAKFTKIYLSKPYPGKVDMHPKGLPNRLFHGVLHAILTAELAEALNEIYNIFWPLVDDKIGKIDLDEKQLYLLKAAAFLHDIANTGEVFDDEAKQAEMFKQIMLEEGYSEEELEPFICALRNKDNKHSEEILNDPFKVYIRRIIHDSDVFEILRLRKLPKSWDKPNKDEFNYKCLETYEYFTNNISATLPKTVIQSIIKFIERYSLLHNTIYQLFPIKKNSLGANSNNSVRYANNFKDFLFKLETSPNPYEQVCMVQSSIMIFIRLNEEYIGNGSYHDMAFDPTSVLRRSVTEDFKFNKLLLAHLRAIIYPELEKFIDKEIQNNNLLRDNKNSKGLIIRCVKSFHEESKKIQSLENAPFAARDFHKTGLLEGVGCQFLPATLLHRDVPVAPSNWKSFAVLYSAKTQVSLGYKTNIYSHSLFDNFWPQERSNTNVKALNPEDLATKIATMNLSRSNLTAKLSLYGRNYLSHSELLMLPQFANAIGLCFIKTGVNPFAEFDFSKLTKEFGSEIHIYDPVRASINRVNTALAKRFTPISYQTTTQALYLYAYAVKNCKNISITSTETDNLKFKFNDTDLYGALEIINSQFFISFYIKTNGVETFIARAFDCSRLCPVLLFKALEERCDLINNSLKDINEKLFPELKMHSHISIFRNQKFILYGKSLAKVHKGKRIKLEFHMNQSESNDIKDLKPQEFFDPIKKQFNQFADSLLENDLISSNERNSANLLRCTLNSEPTKDGSSSVTVIMKLKRIHSVIKYFESLISNATLTIKELKVLEEPMNEFGPSKHDESEDHDVLNDNNQEVIEFPKLNFIDQLILNDLNYLIPDDSFTSIEELKEQIFNTLHNNSYNAFKLLIYSLQNDYGVIPDWEYYTFIKQHNLPVYFLQFLLKIYQQNSAYFANAKVSVNDNGEIKTLDGTVYFSNNDKCIHIIDPLSEVAYSQKLLPFSKDESYTLTNVSKDILKFLRQRIEKSGGDSLALRLLFNEVFFSTELEKGFKLLSQIKETAPNLHLALCKISLWVIEHQSALANKNELINQFYSLVDYIKDVTKINQDEPKKILNPKAFFNYGIC